MPSIRLVLVEENKALRGALYEALQSAPEIEVIGTVANVRGVVDRLRALAPDVVLMDIHAQDENVLETVRWFRPLLPRAKIAVLMDDEALVYARAVHCGEMAVFLPKTASPNQLVRALQAACSTKRKERRRG